MARYIPIGTPMNRSEEDGIRLLRDALPEHYVVIGNFELQLPRRKNTIEYDALVIGDVGVYAVEIKGWNGRIRGDIRRWQLDWGRVENPFIRTETKAKALRDFLVRRCDGWMDELYCESVVLLTGRKLQLEINDPRHGRLLTMETALDFFRHGSDTTGVEIDAELQQQIVECIAPLANPLQPSKVLRDYEILGELERPDQRYREFVGRHHFIKTRKRVRIKSYELDPLLPKARVNDEIKLIIRDIEALTGMGNNPYVADAYDMIRDVEDDHIFYLVSEWVGKETLSDYIESAGVPDLNSAKTWRVGLHLIRAVSYVHEHDVVHRDLNPSVIYMTDGSDDVLLKIADFDFARIARMDSIADDVMVIGTEGYAAPELWLSDDEYDQRVDVFSVGAILFELMSGQPLYESEMALMRQEEIWALRRDLIMDQGLQDCLYGLLCYDPKKRDADFGASEAFFLKRLNGLIGKS